MEKEPKHIKHPRKYKRDHQPFRLWMAYAALLILIFLPPFLKTGSLEKEITWQVFERDMLRRRNVEKLVVKNGERADVYLRPVRKKSPAGSKDVVTASQDGPEYFFSIGSIEAFEHRMDEAQKDFLLSEKIPVSYVKSSSWLANGLTWVSFFLLFLLLSNSLLKRSGNMGGDFSIFNFGKTTATLVEKEKSTLTFDDVAGLEEAEVEVREILNFLKKPASYTQLGAKIPKGVILVGPPGTGKTLLAKALAGEANVPFFSISGSEFVEMFVGIGASRVRDLFRKAKEKAPCIVFIDEIDAIGRSRGKGAFFSGANDERESTLNQLLTEMDGFGTNSGVIVLAATNRADMLDPALLRPGRFDRHVYLELPNLKDREAIFKVHLRPLVIDEAIDISFLALQTPGFSGADIANICNEAALIAARKEKKKVDKQDFLDAIDRIVAGLEKKSKIISPDEKRIIAYHEAGHAVVSWLLKNVDPLVKVSIIPRGKSLGASWYLPEERQLNSESFYKEHLSATLGGRVAEELIFGEASSGALDDLEKVTKEAYMMVAYFGFSKKIGNVSFYDSSGQSNMDFQKPFSEETGKLIDEEVRRLVNEAYESTRKILTQNRKQLSEIAELLLEKEVLFKEDIENILGVRTKISRKGKKKKTLDQASPSASL